MARVSVCRLCANSAITVVSLCSVEEPRQAYSRNSCPLNFDLRFLRLKLSPTRTLLTHNIHRPFQLFIPPFPDTTNRAGNGHCRLNPDPMML